MQRFELPELRLIRFEAKAILTASQWDLPVIPNNPTEPTNPGDWETPIYP